MITILFSIYPESCLAFNGVRRKERELIKMEMETWKIGIY